ncbi:hypothetical protein CAPTEDRAFT_207214 [Capitella teleta]|uniref:Carbohydrate sulfotransferase n=1 Tax=Capitella teleta TaxID=283909 RepID=R7T704_CAPTE|nr:hypothetical protein CAPTEDRAFT_207214 [Capitella teleta]|eukprot:ELT89340.1 hypothetical protein CAPTEDRAFT_207214 [Capitella teleta]
MAPSFCAQFKAIFHSVKAISGGILIIWILHKVLIPGSSVVDYSHGGNVSNRQSTNYSPDDINASRDYVVRACRPETRLTELHNRCEQQQSKAHDPALAYRQILVDDQHQMLICMVPKAASTSIYNLLYTTMTGETLTDPHCQPCWEKEGLLPLRSFPQSDIKNKLEHYVKIMVTRHPIDRLHSCWNHKFRPQKGSLRMKRPGKRLLEFVHGQSVTGNYTEKLRTMEIPFEDLVKLVQVYEDKPELEHNLHWMPITDLCDPCTIRYDHVLRVESLFRDSKVITDRLKIPHNQFPHMNNFQHAHENVMVPRQIEEFARLPQNLQDNMMQIYEDDLRLFGYGWETPNITCEYHKDGNERCC